MSRAWRRHLQRDGVVVPGLVKALSAHVGGDAAAYTHYRATSQDVVDSSLVLGCSRRSPFSRTGLRR